ncbi:hypothetical protein QQZ08_003330 [Neonectria magnoliae]|uniref:BTB domain-containing protein n=1 Tax=Neonectria magnoliae TaxID=2732573 RepID=A0ABR1IAV4_9HYPO
MARVRKYAKGWWPSITGRQPANNTRPPAEDTTLPPSPTAIDKRGTLVLRVGKNVDAHEHEFSNAMLFGGFRESKPDKGPWIVSLPEDHAASMYVVLNIIHAKFSFVPRSPSMSFIYEIRALVDKYDMAQSLTPWYDDWTKVLKAENIEDGPGLINATTLAWDFGDQEYFTSLVNRLVLESDINNEGYLRIKDDACVLESPSPFGPPDLTGRLVRLQVAVDEH